MASEADSALRVTTSNTTAGGNEVRTPTLISPPDSKTPPTVMNKRRQDALGNAGREDSSEPVDPLALTRALERVEQGGRQRELTPGGSPSRKRQRTYGDR